MQIPVIFKHYPIEFSMYITIIQEWDGMLLRLCTDVLHTPHINIMETQLASFLKGGL